jgi:hypothetical protein
MSYFETLDDSQKFTAARALASEDSMAHGMLMATVSTHTSRRTPLLTDYRIGSPVLSQIR